MIALDIYEKNVLRKRVEETEEDRAIIDRWYQALCDLEEWAFDEENIPEKVKKYL